MTSKQNLVFIVGDHGYESYFLNSLLNCFLCICIAAIYLEV